MPDLNAILSQRKTEAGNFCQDAAEGELAWLMKQDPFDGRAVKCVRMAEAGRSGRCPTEALVAHPERRFGGRPIFFIFPPRNPLKSLDSEKKKKEMKVIFLSFPFFFFPQARPEVARKGPSRPQRARARPSPGQARSAAAEGSPQAAFGCAAALAWAAFGRRASIAISARSLRTASRSREFSQPRASSSV